MDFRDVRFMSAKDKQILLKQWETFIKYGMQQKHFTDRIYKHLTLHCSFIAHYSKSGFYNVYFTSPENTITFLEQFDPNGDHRSVEYGGTWWYTDQDFEDINEAMCKVVGKYINKYRRQKAEEARKRDIEQAKRLLYKHGITVSL